MTADISSLEIGYLTIERRWKLTCLSQLREVTILGSQNLVVRNSKLYEVCIIPALKYLIAIISSI
jgi:hypothetical protein